MHEKIMITGTNGFVGARALMHFSDAIPVPPQLVRNPCDDLANFVVSQNPDIIINCAAISDIGTCEKNPQASYTANITLPVTLANAANKIHAKLISFSSDQVYTGCESDGAYSEGLSLPTPANIYAQHKLEAENRVLDINADFVLLRATWMYDMPLFNHQNRGNFLVNTLGSVLHKQELSFSPFEHRGITYVRSVINFLEKTFTLPGGVYNYGSENPLNMYDTAKALLASLGIEDTIIQKNLSKRHDLHMNCDKIKNLGIHFDTTAKGFERCVNDYNLKIK